MPGFQGGWRWRGHMETLWGLQMCMLDLAVDSFLFLPWVWQARQYICKSSCGGVWQMCNIFLHLGLTHPRKRNKKTIYFFLQYLDPFLSTFEKKYFLSPEIIQKIGEMSLKWAKKWKNWVLEKKWLHTHFKHGKCNEVYFCDPPPPKRNECYSF